jgi:hypothetical protein
MLAGKLVELEVVDSISPETVHSTLRKAVKPWLKQQWCLPKKHDGEFVWRMEDVLEVYHRPDNPRFPVICMDEASKQLVGEVRQPLPLRPGQPLRYDSEYERLGTCNIFMFVEPLRGYRHVRVYVYTISLVLSRLVFGPAGPVGGRERPRETPKKGTEEIAAKGSAEWQHFLWQSPPSPLRSVEQFARSYHGLYRHR